MADHVPTEESIKAAQQARTHVDTGARFAAVIVVTAEGAMAIGTCTDEHITKGWTDNAVRDLNVRLLIAAAKSIDGQLGDLPITFSGRPM